MAFVVRSLTSGEASVVGDCRLIGGVVWLFTAPGWVSIDTGGVTFRAEDADDAKTKGEKFRKIYRGYVESLAAAGLLGSEVKGGG